MTNYDIFQIHIANKIHWKFFSTKEKAGNKVKLVKN